MTAPALQRQIRTEAPLRWYTVLGPEGAVDLMTGVDGGFPLALGIHCPPPGDDVRDCPVLPGGRCTFTVTTPDPMVWVGTWGDTPQTWEALTSCYAEVFVCHDEEEVTGWSRTRTPMTPCPACGRELDGAESLRLYREPQPGDFSLCAYCAEVMRFTEGLVLRALVPGDWLVIHANPELYTFLGLTQAVVQAYTWRRGGG